MRVYNFVVIFQNSPPSWKGSARFSNGPVLSYITINSKRTSMHGFGNATNSHGNILGSLHAVRSELPLRRRADKPIQPATERLILRLKKARSCIYQCGNENGTLRVIICIRTYLLGISQWNFVILQPSYNVGSCLTTLNSISRTTFSFKWLWGPWEARFITN